MNPLYTSSDYGCEKQQDLNWIALYGNVCTVCIASPTLQSGHRPSNFYSWPSLSPPSARPKFLTKRGSMRLATTNPAWPGDKDPGYCRESRASASFIPAPFPLRKVRQTQSTMSTPSHRLRPKLRALLHHKLRPYNLKNTFAHLHFCT